MLNRSAFVVVGLGYGDEGKGLAVDYLCSQVDNPLVIRFNGGHQAGHTVVTEGGRRHTFSSFGAGSFRGAPTLWSRFCTMSPVAILSEYSKIRDKKPRLYIDPCCLITTHYDLLYNRAEETSRGNNSLGSVGLGVGATIRRNEYTSYTLIANDLLDFNALKIKLGLIREYYKSRFYKTGFDFNQFDHDKEDHRFLYHVRKILALIPKKVISILPPDWSLMDLTDWRTLIFEGAQGVLLDRNYGFSPYVTQSNTTSKNAFEILGDHGLDKIETKILYVSRCYHTRHGSGPFMETDELQLHNTQDETNKNNRYQGVFKKSFLNIDLLNYAISCDSIFSRPYKKQLLVTCLDQIQSNSIKYYRDGLVESINVAELSEIINEDFEKFYTSYGPYSGSITIQNGNSL